MRNEWVSPFDETLFWSAIGMSCASVVVLLVGGGIAELFGSSLARWVTLLFTVGLSAPCAGMVIGADTCGRWDDPVSRSAQGFAIGGGILGGCVVAAIELVMKLG